MLLTLIACGDKDGGGVVEDGDTDGGDDTGTSETDTGPSDSGSTDSGGGDSGETGTTSFPPYDCGDTVPWDPGSGSEPSALTPSIGDLRISTSSQLDAFCDDYDAVFGSLIVGVPQVGDLDGLSCLKVVQGSLRIDSPALARLSLPSLRVVDGDLSIVGADQLTELELPALEQIGGHLELDGLPSLTRVDTALPRLLRVGGRVDLSGLSGLELAAGPPTLAYVGASVVVTGPASTDTLSFPALRTVVGPFQVSGLSALSTLELDALEWVGGLEIEDGELASLRLPALQMVDGTLRLEALDDLVDLDGLADLRCWRGVQLIDLQRLASASALRGRTDHPTDVAVERCRELADLDWLEDVETVDGSVSLVALPRLSSLGALAELRSVAGPVRLDTCRVVADLTGLASLESVGGLTIEDMDVLVDLSGLEALRHVEGDLNIVENDELFDVVELASLERVTGDLTITDNRALTPYGVDLLLEALGEDVVEGSITAEDNAE
ncbi:MAG: hypothetical protein H6742_12005 [Alphaproteobacteria bacterium]|nr:hypothetical protein [Alphaproteobacteria bacterium]